MNDGKPDPKFNPDTPEGREYFLKRARGMEDATPETDATGFLMRPGYYYLAMWYIELNPVMTKFGKGGNITFMVCRNLKDETRWFFRYRFRHYRHSASEAWDGTDVFTWYNYIINRPSWEEEAVFKDVDNRVTQLAMVGGEKDKTLIIRGDVDQFYRALQNQQPRWMQIKIIDPDEQSVKE